MATKIFKGKFINDHTFVDEEGNEIDLIPSVLEIPNESNSQAEPSSDDSDEFEWDGPTKEGESPTEEEGDEYIEEPDPSFTYVDEETGISYQWDAEKKEFYEVGEIE